MVAATHIAVERFEPRNAPPPPSLSPEAHGQWLRLWEQLGLGDLHGFPLWEKEVHDMLLANLDVLQSIFAAYACSSSGQR